MSAINLRSKALTEYELRHDALYYIAGKNNCGKLVVLEHDVFDVIVHTHNGLSLGVRYFVLWNLMGLHEYMDVYDIY